ncbi:DUF1294 domain-containing protein [Kaistella flava (ex Peng et al. 2021)]|uniref:DUF1294 domain-containing protein n=1 Tax=Kaistella flava (ex Peng et al. 2021) TaxID=2038776 RepID=A0A7M2YBH4_9FLAO|nr:DUF1294 domain-containing protein [Kaistella flava (ex Peng et al. 2021)]QOW11440.1 DUF1294 domain-containing protein [Kaistella flava (ex Peng et al. 2021)]
MNPFQQAYLLTLSIGSFIYFAVDKIKAKKHQKRVPENSLLLLTLFGGTIGSVLGMIIFNHKTAKKSFIIKMLVVILIQILILYLIYNYHQ